MIVEQISVFIENKEGRLSAIAKVLAENEIDVSALSLADTEDFGVLRMILCNPRKAKEALAKSGVICKITDVLAVALEDRPGGFSKALGVLANNGISVNYMYASTSHEKGKAIMILSVDEVKKAEEILSVNELNAVKPSDIYRISEKE